MAGELATDPGAAALGTATTELVRALLASAAQDERFSRPALADALLTRVMAYVRAHLTDPALSPHSIARAHSVSVRQLYKVCAAADLSLEQWIIDQRLEAARTALVSPDGRRRSIAATAHATGFRDPSHFTRRFRAAYGVTPRGTGSGSPRPTSARHAVQLGDAWTENRLSTGPSRRLTSV